jgi:pimeloyl-ACP methyl ester carboxylesterase
MTFDQLSPPTKAWLNQGRHIEVEGKRVFTVERGTGPTVLLMHGFPTSGYDWRGVMEALSGSYRCVAFDLPGFGLSDKPDAYSYSLFQQTDVVEGLARELGISSAHVVSHDIGTSIHCELLARAQEGRLAFEIERSTFLNGSMLQWCATITPFQKLLASNETLQQAIDLCNSGLDAYVAGLKGIMKKPDAVTAEDEVVMRELLDYQQGYRRLAAASCYMRERYINSERWLGALEKATAPLQFVWADGDPVANIAMGREMCDRYPKARYTELAGLGHFLLIEDPAAIAREVRTFAEQRP